jgi:hypothetical protein
MPMLKLLCIATGRDLLPLDDLNALNIVPARMVRASALLASACSGQLGGGGHWTPNGWAQ